MDIYDNTNVLDEVESLFNKFDSVPEPAKHGDFSKIQEKVSIPCRTKFSLASKNTFLSLKDQNFKPGVEKKKDNFSSNIGKIRTKDGLSFAEEETSHCRNTKRLGWESSNCINDTFDTLHEILFPDESDNFFEDSYPWNDHAYENKTNLANFAHSVEDENKWLFEEFPISPRPSNFHIHNNFSGTFDGSKTSIDSKAIEKLSRRLPVDPSKKPFVCPECCRAFPDVYHLNLHQKRHKGEKEYLCDKCPHMNYTMDELQKHIERIHLKTKNILCEYCGSLFVAMVDFKEHMKLKHCREETFLCYKCNYITYSLLSLKKHMLRVHQSQRYLLQCHVCGLTIKRRQNLIDHIKTHIKHKSYSCDICGKTFSLEKRLSIHKKTVHQARQFSCDVCHKLFQTKFHLDRHVTIHFNTRPFPCPYCLYASNTHGNLSKHVKSVHQKKDFSIKKFKNPHSLDQVNVNCIEKGKAVTIKYLNDISKQLGEEITIKSLQEQRLLQEMAREVELLKSKKLSKHHQPPADHSYSEKLQSATGSTEATVAKIDLERSLQAHYQRLQEDLYCTKSDTATNKTDQMLSGGVAVLNV